MTATRYSAFISYSHTDEVAAARLLKRLETYRLPLPAAQTDIRRLGPFFMDRETLPAADSLNAAILDGLRRSDALVVLCSRAAARSVWVNREIVEFRRINPKAPIYPVIIDEAETQGSDALTLFPEHLLADEREPLSADMRKARDGARLGFLKLVSALTDTPLSDLLRKDVKRRNNRVMAVTAAASFIALTMGVLAMQANASRKIAEERQAQLEGMVDFMIVDLNENLEPVGRLGIMDDIAVKVLDYYDGHDASEFDCKQAARKARAHHIRNDVLVVRSQYEAADAEALEAIKILDALESDCQQVPEFVVRRAHADYWSANADWRRTMNAMSRDSTEPPSDAEQARRVQQLGDAKSHYESYLERTLAMPAQGVDHDQYLQELADSYVNLGSIAFHEHDYDGAKNYFEKTVKTIEPLAQRVVQNPFDYSEKEKRDALYRYADANGWIAAVAEARSDVPMAVQYRTREAEIFRSMQQVCTVDWNAYRAALGSEFAALRLSRSERATEQYSRRIGKLRMDADRLLRNEPDNGRWQRFKCAVCELAGEGAESCSTEDVRQCNQQEETR